MAETLSFTPDATRTHDLLLRRQSLYPAELPGRAKTYYRGDARVSTFYSLSAYIRLCLENRDSESTWRPIHA